MKNNKKYFLKKVSNYAMVGGLGSLLITSFAGCEDKNASGQGGQSNAFTQASQKQGAFVIIEKTSQGGYTIVESLCKNFLIRSWTFLEFATIV